MPVLRLKTGIIALHRNGARPIPQRFLFEAPDFHTISPLWGGLAEKQQWLVTPDLASALPPLADSVQSAGGHVIGHVPDNSLLVMGPLGLQDALARLPHVTVTAYEPQHKLSPEWDAVLERLAAARDTGGPSSWAAIAALPVSVVGHGAGQRLEVIAVFPPFLGDARGLAPSDPGKAAAADWGPLLGRLFGPGVEVARGGALSVVVLCPPAHLEGVLTWLAARPGVHWVAPMQRGGMHNIQGSAISQAGVPALSESTNSNADPAVHPVWAAGLTGKGQIIGGGDSGMDYQHCFFYDAAVDWSAHISLQDGKQVFDSTEHRKIRYYRAYGDFTDPDGHGTHVMGTAVGATYDANISQGTNTEYIGMAPEAKVAFIDMGSGTDAIYIPTDIQNEFFAYTTGVGASLHSDSWGIDSVAYDYLAAQVDQFHWNNPDFLAMFAAGNDGQKSGSGTTAGETTVSSPATAKNIIAVGATQTTGEYLGASATTYVVFDASVTQNDQLLIAFKVIQATFGNSVSTLGTTRYDLVAADPLMACDSMVNASASAGAVVLVERGSCVMTTKSQNVQDAGGAAVIVFDNVLGGYFTSAANGTSGASITVPSMSITRRLGQTLLASLSSGLSLTISFSPSTAPVNSFDNLAAYSSQGPTLDGRVKPDLVAPGSLQSAKTGYGNGRTCALQGMMGTSMATPVVAGSAALVRQWYVAGWYPSGSKNASAGFTPSGALVKSTLISGATTLTGFEALTGLPIDPPPSFRQGYGRVLLESTIPLPDSDKNFSLQMVDRVEVSTGDFHRFCVRSTGGPITVTLVWTDYPALPSVSKALVNDLDLTVRASGLGGIPLLGNGGSISNETLPDRENNVEQVTMAWVPIGPVAIEVAAHYVYSNGGAQPYALTVNGAFSGTLVVPSEGSGQECTIVVPVITAGPSGPTNQDPVTFAFAAQSSTSGLVWECALADGEGQVGAQGTQDWAVCASPASFQGLPDGPYEFSVRAQGETTQANRTFTLDTVPPVLAFGEGSPVSGSTSDAATANISFAATDSLAVNYTCTLGVEGAAANQGEVFFGEVNPGPWSLGKSAPCTSPAAFHWMLPGSWRLDVVAQDAAGNTADTATYSWTVAFEAGQQYARISSGPLGTFRLLSSVEFNFSVLSVASSGDTVSTVSQAGTQCWLDQAGSGASNPTWTTCTSPKVYTDLAQGSYTFYAQPLAAATLALTGQSTIPTGGTTAISTFSLDGTPPVASITAAPPAILAVNFASANFTADKEGTVFTCQLSGSGNTTSAAACTSPMVMTGLEDGNYTLSVIPTDPVGNVGDAAKASFLVDTTPPTFTNVTFPEATQQNHFTVTFTASDGNGSGVAYSRCRLQSSSLFSNSTAQADADWANCMSPTTFSDLEEGHWLLDLEVADAAGNVATTGNQNVWIDSTPPIVAVASGPSSFETVSGSLHFSFEMSDTSPSGAAPIAVYQLRLASISADTFAALKNGSLGSSTGTLASVGGGRRLLAAADGTQSSVQGSAALQGWSNCSSNCDVTGLGSGTYTHSVRGIDLAGNVGNATQAVPFEFVASSSSSSFPTWAIGVAAGGGALLILVLILLGCCCWRRRRRQKELQGAPSGAQSASHPGVSAACHGQPTAYQGQAAAYQGQAAAYQGQPLPPGWPVAQPWTQPYAAGPGQQYAPQYMPPYPGQPALYAGQIRPDARQVSSRVAREEQELALALAASRREAELAQQRAQQSLAPVFAMHPAPEAADADLHAALQASLAETRQDEDAALRAAIAASLEQQNQTQQWHPWGR